MAVDDLLSRLERVRRTGPGRWIASSPIRFSVGIDATASPRLY